jgi:uncharacterized protein
MKNIHEIRDPIHIFIKLDSDERKVLDSRPFQRLRYIHQLALTYLIYPGATHKRFEHSLGVMELADRMFQVLTHSDNLTDQIKGLFPELSKKNYWRSALRMAALCHDIGHLPFSHAAEKELLPDGWSHEKLTREIILSDEMKEIWGNITPPLRPNDIVKLAVGPKEALDLEFSDWETVLSEIIVGDAFGADRIDYLLRDSHHVGVAYGKFDHYRLIDTLRILPPPKSGDSDDDKSREPSLGIEKGGLQSAESLLFARYSMYSQVYFHPIRRIYDIHLKDFLMRWLKNGRFSTIINEHLSITDCEVTSALRQIASDSSNNDHEFAKRIINRKHFKVIYERNPTDYDTNNEAALLICKAAEENFGKDKIRFDSYTQKGGFVDFPVLLRDGTVASSLSLSQTLAKIPVVAVDYVFIDPNPDNMDRAQKWLNKNKIDIIKIREEKQ